LGEQKKPYIVHWSKIHAIFYSVALKLPVMEYEDFAVCIVDGNRLGITILSLVTLLDCAPAGPLGVKYPSSMCAEKCAGKYGRQCVMEMPDRAQKPNSKKKMGDKFWGTKGYEW
jgi:hypothetical protein